MTTQATETMGGGAKDGLDGRAARSRIEPTPPLRPSREAMVADDDADEDVLSPQHYLSYV